MSDSTAVAEKPLPDFVDLDLARRLEMAETISPDCYEALRRYGPSDPIALLKVAGGYAFCCGPDYPVNQIVGMGLYDEVTAADLDQLEDFFRSRGVPCSVVLSPMAHASLRMMLGERGYSIAEFNTVLIRRIQPEEPFSPPPGIVIERVTDDTIGPWMRAVAKGFEQEIVVAESVFGGFAVLPGALPFLARIEDKVVGGCGGRVIPEARIAAFFGTATLPEYRGRGVQSALIAKRLHEAALAGCEYAVVSTNPGSGSQRNMERRGFHVAYTKAVMMRAWPDA
jgi:GNAT superfamily N-acetyltransferase